MSRSKKLYALVDCNSFFCSCERLFRPDLNNRPVGVLSNNDGCFISRTPELKTLGIKMAQPYFQVKEVCQKNNVAVFSSNFALYTNISHRVTSVLAEMAPTIEVYSVDEAFLDLSGFKNIEAYAHKIKQEVFKRVGVPVSVGVGPTKTLAKVANKWAKDHPSCEGVQVLIETNKQDEILSCFDVADVWGVGRASVTKMQSLGIQTAKDFRDYENSKLIKKTFSKLGLQRQEELRGLPRFELETIPVPRQGITSSRSFGKAVLSLDDLREAVAHYVSHACEKLRKQKSVTQRLRVFIRTSRYIAFEQSFRSSKTIEFDSATNDTRKVIRYAMGALDKLYQSGYKYKKAGVDLSGIESKDRMQLSLLESANLQKTDRLMQAMDFINQKEGPGTLKSAICFLSSGQKKWQMTSKLRSPTYVNGWSHLPKVK